MRFEDIRQSILNYINRYETERNIKTLNVECRIKKDNWAIFVAYKSDNSQSCFFARETKRTTNDDGWIWFCPSESEAEKGFPLFLDIYEIINSRNKKERSHIDV